MTSSTPQEYTFYFKIAYTDRTMLKSFPITLRVSDFIEQVKSIAKTEFNLPETHQIEVVEAECEYMGRPAEEAPALAPAIHSLEHIYRDRLRNIAFYLRLQEEERAVSPDVVVEDEHPNWASQSGDVLTGRWERPQEAIQPAVDGWNGQSSGWEASGWN